MENENKQNQATDSVGKIEFAGRSFEKTEKGFEELQAYGKELSALTGRQSNEVGEARKQLSQFQRIVAELPEEVKQVLQSEDASPEGKMLAQFIGKRLLEETEAKATSQLKEWYQEAVEGVVQEMPELAQQVDKEFIEAFLLKHNLHAATDPLTEAKSLLSKKVKKAEPGKKEDKSSQDSTHISVDGGGTGSAKVSRSQNQTKQVQPVDVWSAFGINKPE